jgi:hypothetical protein
MAYAPIALFVYKRLAHTKTTIESLLENKEAADSILYIYSDAAKNEKDAAAVQEVRDYIRTLSGFKELHIITQPQNRGLANSIISGVTQVIEKHGTVIVIEDDLLLSPWFLKYMNDGLASYERNDRVASIHGYTYPLQHTPPETFFLRGADCWGWATWARAWKVFNPDAAALLAELRSRNLESEFDFSGYAGNIRMLQNQIEGKIDSWAIRWHASAFLANMFTLYPGNSLVQNIGMDGGGTHSDTTTIFRTTLAETPIHIIPDEPKSNPEIIAALTRYYKKSHAGLFGKVLRRIKKLLH